MLPTEADVEALLSHGAIIRDSFRWRTTGKYTYKTEAWLEETYEGAPVRLCGTLNSRIMNYSYALIWGGARVRGLDMGGRPHPNPDGQMIAPPHKHRWTDEFQARVAYRPTDITETTVEGVLYQFLAECNIRFEGTYYKPSDQGRLVL